MGSPITSNRAPSRALLGGISVSSVATLVHGYVMAQRKAGAHRWDRLGLDWLTLDTWSSEPFWMPSLLLGAGAALLLFLLARTPLRGLGSFLGNPLVAVLALACALLLPGGLASARRPTPPQEAPNLVFVLIDTWRADHAGFLGYERDVSPNLDSLSQRGVVFERAIAPSGWTKPSVATLLTGLIPSVHTAVSLPMLDSTVRGARIPFSKTTLMEALRSRGWDTAAWSNNPNILPGYGFGQGVADFTDYVHHPDKTRRFDPGRAERMIPDVERWLAEEADGGRPFFTYVHIMDPHYPYVAPPPFQGTFDHSGLDFQLRGDIVMQHRKGQLDITPEMHQRLVDIYDEELLYVDHHVGPFLERILAEHPNTVVLVVGDHGEEFLEHGSYGHSHSVYEELTHVPMLLLGPDLEPARVPWQVRLMDVFPTLLELAGVRGARDPEVAGESLVSLLEGRESAHRLAPLENGGDQRPVWQWRGLNDGERVVLRREEDLPTYETIEQTVEWENEPRPYWMLFDLADDPTQQENLFRQREEEARALFELFVKRGWYHDPKELLELEATDLDVAGDLEELERLGYGGGG